jgi:phosphatidylinositol 3-kinase
MGSQQRDPKTHEMYINVMRRFSQALLKVSTQQTP